MDVAWSEFAKWPYEEHLWHVEVAVSDHGFAARQDVYADEANLLEFADGLASFPRAIDDTVSFEIGKRDPGWAHWLMLRAAVVDGVGHAGLVVETSNNREGRFRREAHFVVPCEPASLNRLGVALRKWIGSEESTFRVELKNG